MSYPPMVTVPDVAERQPVIMFMVVDFPAPFGPQNPQTVPSLTEKLILSTALWSP